MTAPPFDTVLQLIDGVEGWLSDDQARALYGAAVRCRPGGRIVEIGSFRGRSAIVLATAAGTDVEIVAIDPHAGNDRGPQEFEGFQAEAATDSEVFLGNLRRAGVLERVTYVREYSHEAHGAVDGPISVLFVDGAHRLRPALADLRQWGARVEDGGTMYVHDSFSSIGVTLALLRTCLGSPRLRYLGRARSLAIYAVGPVGPVARISSAMRQVAQLPWFARNVLIKVLVLARLGRLTRLLGHRDAAWPY